jgi:hypothetical protein
MTAIADFTTVIETLIGRALTGQQLANIGASFVALNPYNLADDWTDGVYFLQAADVVDGGTGYVADDVLTVEGGTGEAATLLVTSVDAGVITSVSVETQGAYSVPPDNPISVTGGNGTGAAFTGVGGAYQVPRPPTNEETAQRGLDSFAHFGRWVHGQEAETTARATAEGTVDEQVQTAVDTALEDLQP